MVCERKKPGGQGREKASCHPLSTIGMPLMFWLEENHPCTA